MNRAVAAAIIAVAAASTPAAEPKPTPRDEQDLVFFRRDRPVRIRLHLQIEGRSFQSHWDEIVARLFQFLDADGDGRLSAKESEHAPSERQLRQLIQGAAEVEADEPPRYADLGDDPKGVTLDQVKGYYHRIGVAPWQIDWVGRNSYPVHLDDEVCRLLNPARPEELTRDRLKDATRLIDRLDADGDETISPRELSRQGYFGGFLPPSSLGAPAAREAARRPFFLLDPSNKGRTMLAKETVQRYDRDQNGKLGPAEVAFEPALFRGLDRDGDGLLDAAELARWPEGSADLAVLLRLDGEAAHCLFLVPDATGKPLRLAPAVAMSRVGAARLALGDDFIEVVRGDGLEAQQRRLEDMSLVQFKALDRNRDDVLTSTEAYQPPFALVPLLRLADRDGDSKLALKEFQAFLELRKKMVTRSLVVTVIDRGRCLFDLLDADHDHRLGRRELLTAAARLAPWLGSGGAVTREKLPQQYQIIVSQGTLPQPDGDPGGVIAGRPESRLRGPTWFRKMDRNADGDVSAAEFLGTVEQFRKLDSDGDGLISLAEAEPTGMPRGQRTEDRGQKPNR